MDMITRGTDVLDTVDSAVSEALTRLGRGASRAERSAVKTAVESLFYGQGHVTRFQSAAIVHAAVLTAERVGRPLSDW